jgi:hypothetical protein
MPGKEGDVSKPQRTGTVVVSARAHPLLIRNPGYSHRQLPIRYR